jgi:hypothetical protein
MSDLTRSCADCGSYPQNLLRTRKFGYALKDYHRRMMRDRSDFLLEEGESSLQIADLLDNEHGEPVVRDEIAISVF